MAWTDRLKEAAYTSPSGQRLRFDYENVSRETPKRTAAFEFPGVDGAYIQDNGFGARKYPLRCFFWGPDCDQLATVFEAMLLERGVGRLEHPLYGTFDVVPFGDITRRDDLKEAANQTVIEVTFWTTTGVLYPSSQRDPENEIFAAIESLDAVGADQFANSTDLDGAGKVADEKAVVGKQLQSIGGSLEDVANADAETAREFRGLKTSIGLSLDALIAEPKELAAQLAALTRIPAQIEGDIEGVIDAYEDLLDDIFDSPAGNPGDALETGIGGKQRRTRVANDFHTADLGAMNAISGCITAVTNTTFSTRPQAITVASRISDLFDAVVSWRDEGFEDLSAVDELGAYQVDTGEGYQALQRAVALTLGFLIEISFTLVPERRIVLDRPRTIIDLCAELYGTVDDKLDFMIASNGLNGDEILEVPAGRTIKYYAAA